MGVVSEEATWTDSHCHVQDGYLPEDEALDAVLGRAASAKVGRIVVVGTDLETSTKAVALAQERARGDGFGGPRVWATIGLHPHEASRGTEQVEAYLASLEREPSPQGGLPPGAVVAVGECGLDYHYEHSPRHAQRNAFGVQIELAKRYGLALVVHTRDAWDDTVSILAEHGPPGATVIHCFTGGPREAERCLELGAYLSFSGIVTFRTAEDVRDAARLCPTDRLLVETDAPFLAPVPYRGRPNEPSLVRIVGEALATLRGVEPAELAATSTAAAIKAFGLG
jgi:TatD DNase family protein